VPEGLPLIKGDPVLLAQLIANLLDNALTYSEGPIELSVSAQAHVLEVSVKDRGPGLSDAQQASLFAPHVRGDHPGVRGAGLGLAVCKAIAEAHGARLTHRHAQRRGQPVFAAAARGKRAAGPGGAMTLRVLVVEDDREIRSADCSPRCPSRALRCRRPSR
jgi:signal transduction histidine kinase